MFENLLHQDLVRSRLREEVDADQLPQSLLFHGPSFSAKLTAALELARALNCTQKRKWSCHCLHCEESRILTQFTTLLIGYRDCIPEIKISVERLRKSVTVSNLYRLIRSTRKLVRRFDILRQVAEEKKRRSYEKNVQIIEEILNRFYSYTKRLKESNAPPDETLLKEWDTLLETVLQTSLTLNNDLALSISIDQVRGLIRWSHETSTDGVKVVIIEDLAVLEPSARNALLKLLEEPPKGLYLLTLSSRPLQIMPTLLSRLRKYAFVERSLETQQEVLLKIFDKQDQKDLATFFAEYDQFETPQVGKEVDSFIQNVLDRTMYLPSKNTQTFGVRSYQTFLSLLIQTLFQRVEIQNDLLLQQFREKVLHVTGKFQGNMLTYRQNPKLILNSLFIEIQRSYRQFSKEDAEESRSTNL